jgi:uncharacterized protein YbjQ (UPF0145 family)
MEISTSILPGKRLGMVTASYVGSKVFYKDFFNSVRNFFGWELKSYTDMLDVSVDKVIERLVEKSNVLDATGISNLKFEITYMSSGSLAVTGYADAVVVK